MIRTDEVRSALLDQIVELMQVLYPSARRDKNSFWLGSLRGELGHRLRIEAVGEGVRGTWIDSNSGEKGGIFDLIQASLGLDFRQALAWACSFLDLPPPLWSFAVPLTREGTAIGFANLRALEAGERRLQQHPDALAYLTGTQRGLTQTTIKHFRLGLTSYTSKQIRRTAYQYALTYPQMDSEGRLRSRFPRCWMPGVTIGTGVEKSYWASGLPSTYWVTPAGTCQDLLVCADAGDGWSIWQALQESSVAKRLCVISSTHGSAFPEEWKTSTFWSLWDNVYAAQDANESGDSLALKLRDYAGRDVRRLRIPASNGMNWTEYFNGGATLSEFLALLQGAPLVTQHLAEPPVEAVVPVADGLYHVTPVDLSRAFINGFLYYPFRALEVDHQDGQRLQRWRDLILRSDGTICKADYLPALTGTPKGDRVLALDDGTILSKMPGANPLWTTFTTDAINLFSTARKERKSALTLKPAEMLTLIDRHLRSRIVLPNEHDYAILTYIVIVSYVQSIFEAVPLVLIMGIAGSGKSELGAALAQISCNAVVLNGQTSAASVARIIDSVGGLAILDDLEGIGASTKSKGEFKDLIQQLKVSYKRITARKAWTNAHTMKVEELNFYGVKVINNTEGVDITLGTRMLKIYTQKISRRDLDTFTRPKTLKPEELVELRTNLHIWAMEYAQAINRLYQEKFSHHSERQEEITAPLRLLAELMGDVGSSEHLAMALRAQDPIPNQAESGATLLRLAAKELIRQGSRDYIAMPHLELEMRRMTGRNVFDETQAIEIPEWHEPRWVGRQLRLALVVDPMRKEQRPRLWGRQIRLYPLDPDFVKKTISELSLDTTPMGMDSIHPLAYCEDTECATCCYSMYCKIKENKASYINRYRIKQAR